MNAEQLAKTLRENFSPAQCEAFISDCARGLARELRRRTVLKTPVGDYSGAPYVCASGLSHKGRKVSGKQGGRLRDSSSRTLRWHNSRVSSSGDKYTVTLKNTALSDKKAVPYGLYVEFGHRIKRKLKPKRMGVSRRYKIRGVVAGHRRSIRWVPGHKMLTNAAKDVQDAAQGYIEKKLNRKLGGILK